MVKHGYLGAVDDFRRARRQATLERLVARLRNHPNLLLSYEEVRRITGAKGERNRGLQEVALDRIVGSVDRYSDFTRTFLPLNDSMEERWARVMYLADSREGWPPIEVYQIGDAYFVIDGHHRVSAAQAMGVATFPAYVIEVEARVPVHADDDVEQLLVRREAHEFARRTGLPETRPRADLRVTEAGATRALLEHIDVHRYYMGLEQQREIGYEEAAAHWYDAVYEPIAATVRRAGLLEEFSERTEADLYLWLVEHRAELERILEQEVRPERAAEDLKQRADGGWQPRMRRFGDTLRRAMATTLSWAA